MTSFASSPSPSAKDDYWGSTNRNDEEDDDDDNASWVSNLFDLVAAWDHPDAKEETKANANATHGERSNELPTPPPRDEESPSSTSPQKKDSTEKKINPMLQRASTVSTILDSEHFSFGGHAGDANASVDLYHDGEEGWEMTLSNSKMRRRMERYTRHPHFVRRMGICTLISILAVVLIAVLSATLSNGDGSNMVSAVTGTASNSTSGPPNSPGSSDGQQPQGNDNSGTDGGSGVDDSTTTDPNDEEEPSSSDIFDTSLPSSNNDASSVNDLDQPASPFSTLDPIEDLGLFGVVHSRIPPTIMDDDNKVVPTNTWYQNLIVGAEPNQVLKASLHKAYVVPYLVDVAGPIAGLRTHPNHLDATATLVQLHVVETHGLTLGAAGGDTTSKAYSIVSTNPLGLTLQWNALGMTSSIIRGMPYSTMHYNKAALFSNGNENMALLPTIASEIALQDPPVVDNGNEGVTLQCSSASSAQPTRVERELKLTFLSDYTWMVFFSEPVLVQCTDNGSGPQFQVVQLANDKSSSSSSQLTIRAAVLTSCTNNLNAIYCADGNSINANAIPEYETLLRDRAHLYPGPNSDVRYGVNTTADRAVVRLDWDVQDMTKNQGESVAQGGDDDELFMYALPHHLSRITDTDKWMPWTERFCVSSLVGATCAVTGSTWNLEEDVPIASFRAPRPPRVEALSQIAKALKDDITYVIPENFQRGAGDTYFSGKVLARVGRVLLIHEELEDLCNGKAVGYDLTNEQKLAYMNACMDLTLPTDEEVTASLKMLRQSVEVWINGTAAAAFAYDSAWGGVINCGCVWNGGGCSNGLPDCPAITSDGQGLNFGSAFYNDHHFHYGYHINAAATLAHFDREWGRRHFEDVLLLIRDIANPSSDDAFFPRFRHKDWYQGSSWASGITLPTFGNVVNQESTSEAIAGYEAVALYGREMMEAWKEVNEPAKSDISRGIRDAGLVAAATEIRSTNSYWHVRRDDDSTEIYPSGYQHNVVGILWSTMIQFTTWFGNAPYLIYGIQLLPLTPIAENRDANQAWLREMYEPLARSCVADTGCTAHGWSILQLAMLASLGHADTAMEQAQLIPDTAFDSPGGNGHSMTNTLHYFATRPRVDEPADVTSSALTVDVQAPASQESTLDCGVPQTCTADVLSTNAAGYTCRERIAWLMDVNGMEETVACQQVARSEFPTECGACVNVV